jgi:RNA polymerase sigma-70 factor (ECF subfamily)
MTTTTTTTTTNDAVQRARFEAEALLHLDAMYSFALKLARVRDEAEDLVSDTVLRAFERWEQYRLGTNIRAWLFTILYHVFVSRKRRIDAREVPEGDGETGWSVQDLVGDADPESRFYDSFLDETIVRAIDALPDEYRAAVVLSDIQEMRYAEIAQILSIPEGTVKSRLFRGRRLLQRTLRTYAEDMGYIKAGCAAA